MLGSYYNNLVTIKDKDRFVKENLTNMGFDSAMYGTTYLIDMIHEVVQTPTLLHSICTKLIEQIAKKYNKTIKTISGDIRWSIKKAFSKGILQSVPCFYGSQIPSTKQIVTFLFDFFTN